MADDGVKRVVVWGSPPEPRTRWESHLAPLMEQPGRFAKVMEGPTAKMTKIAWALRHKYRLPPGKWSFVCRSVGNGRSGIWATYLGEEE